MKKFLLLLAAVVLALSLTACGAIRDKIADAVQSAVANITAEPEESAEQLPTEKANETARESTSEPEESAIPEQTATLEDMGIGDFTPEEIPSFVPKFQYGTYVEKDSGKLAAGGSAIYTMNFSGVGKKDLEEFVDLLKEAGYSDTVLTEYGGSVMVAGNYKKDGRESSVVITLNTTEGACVVLITVVSAK